MKKQTLLLLLVFSAVLAVEKVSAAEVSGVVNFTAGTPARAAEVNANFAAVKTAVDDNDARIAALEAEVATLKNQLANVLAISQFLSLENINGQPTVRFSGVNLQVVNGGGSTETANGVGNIIIGYDEPRTDNLFFAFQCSLGTNPNTRASVTNQSECTDAGGTWALNHKSGSHYLVVGREHNYSRWGGIVVGFRNTSNFDFASVSGGRNNTASGTSASVSGGRNNTARGGNASVSGGLFNIASGSDASVSGGSSNTASRFVSSVSGGNLNTASGVAASVSGGSRNTASGDQASVSGGGDGSAAGANLAEADFSSILGGVGQVTTTVGQTIPALP